MRSSILLFCAVCVVVPALLVSRAASASGAPDGPGGERGAPSKAKSPPSSATTPPPYDKVYVLCIGINEYANPVMLPDLRFAENDARSLAGLFEKEYGYSVSLLLGEQATNSGIKSAVEKLASQPGPNDVLIFYFAGHGMSVLTTPQGVQDKARAQEGYLMPHDLDLTPKNIDDESVYRAGAVSMRELSDRLMGPAVRAKHVLLLLDCCASGMAASSRSAGLSREFTYELASSPSRQIITAGKDSQKAYEIVLDESKGDGHGVFTYALLKLLRSKNAQDVMGILPDLRQEVFSTVRQKFNERVMPQHKVVDASGDYVFIPVGVDWAKAIKSGGKAAGDGRGVAPTSEAEVERVAEVSRSAPPDQSMEQDPAWAARVDEYEYRAGAGDTRAMEVLVMCYTNGIGVPKNPGRAYYWSTQAHEANDARGSAMMAQLLTAGVTGNARNRQAAPAAAAQINQGLPPEVQSAVAGYNLVQALRGKSDGSSTTASRAAAANEAAGLLKGLWKSIGKSEQASFTRRLDNLQTELAKPSVDWNGVMRLLRAWADDIKKMEATAPEQSREALERLRTRVDELWRKARMQKKAELRTELEEAARIVRELDAGAGDK